MKIKTKLTLLIGGGMMLLSIIFLLAGTAFSIHEVLLIKRHDLKVAARRINELMQGSSKKNVNQLKHDINNGLLFAKKRDNLNVTVFDSNGNAIVVFNDSEPACLKKSNYPPNTGNYNQHIHWNKWNYWEIDFYFKGSGCWIRINLIQRLEIQEDMASFFFASLLISIILSLTGGIIITAQILKRANQIENAAHEIASGNLKFRIPDSRNDDEMHKIENNLNVAFSELEDSFNKVMEFSSDIAHELRTPLTIITGEIEVALREKRAPEEYQRLMNNVLEEVALLRKIIDDMLILVKPESAYKAVKFEPIDISYLITETINSYKIISDSKNIKLNYNIESETMVNGLKSLMYLIFSNLIYNAIKYTPESGEISISLITEKKSIVFSISDNGSGIPQKEQDKIFSRFYRIKKSESRGLGLGLAIVKKVCDINNATIALESFEGKGSTFTVKFPLPK